MNFEPAGSAPPAGRLGRLKAMLSPAKALRYVKRLLLLPWNFQKFYDAVQPFQEEMPRTVDRVRRDLAEDIDRHEKRLAERMEQVTKDMRQLKYRFAEFYGALLEELRRQGCKLDQLAGTLAKAEAALEDRPGEDHTEQGRAA